MDALTHRLAAALQRNAEERGIVASHPDAQLRGLTAELTRNALSEYTRKCQEQSGEDHYHGREGG